MPMEPLGSQSDKAMSPEAPHGMRRRRNTVQSTYAEGSLAPGVVYYSQDDDVSVRIESKAANPRQTYLELRNQYTPLSWKLGVGHDKNLHFGYGWSWSADHTQNAMTLDSDGGVQFHGDVKVKGMLYKTYTSSLHCTNGVSAQSSGDFGHRRRGWSVNRGSWTTVSTCPEGFSVVGIGYINALDASVNNYVYPMIDHVECGHTGCKTNTGPLNCAESAPFGGEYQQQKPNMWGTPSICAAGYSALGFQKLDLRNWDYNWRKYMRNFEVNDKSVRLWIASRERKEDSGGAVQARCCKHRLAGHMLQCVDGSKAVFIKSPNGAGGWSSYSQCPEQYTAVGIKQIRFLIERTTATKQLIRPTESVSAHHSLHKYECEDTKCKAWCVGSSCEVWAKCCKVH